MSRLEGKAIGNRLASWARSLILRMNPFSECLGPTFLRTSHITSQFVMITGAPTFRHTFVTAIAAPGASSGSTIEEIGSSFAKKSENPFPSTP